MTDAQPRTESLIDWPTLLRDMGGDEDIMAEIAGLFLEFVDEQEAGVRTAVAAGDPDALQTAAHKLKGSVAQFGYEPARSLAFELEQCGRDGRAWDLDRLCERLFGELDRLCAELRRFLATRA